MTSPPRDDQWRESTIQVVRDIESLVRAGLPREEFFRRFLPQVAGQTQALGGLVWSLTPEGPRPLVHWKDARDALQQHPSLLHAHAEWIGAIFATGESRTIAAGEDGRDSTGPMLFMAAVHDAERPVAVVELLVPADQAQGAREGILTFLERACAAASQAFAPKTQAVAASTTARGDFEQFLWLLWQNSSLDDTVVVAASDGRVILGCDRLTVVVRRGAKLVPLAVSGQKSVNPRANMTQCLVALAEQSMSTGEPIFFRGQTEGLAPTVERILANFLRESAAREVAVVPLFAPERPADPQDVERTSRRSETRRTPLGALVAEGFGEQGFRAEMTERLSATADHVGAALSHSLARERILFLPLFTKLGRLREWFIGRRRAAAAAIGGAILLVVLALMLVPWQYRVEGEGRLMPALQQRVFAPWDGEIVQLAVHAGDRVSEGQVLLTLRNDEIEEKRLGAASQRLEKERLAASLTARVRDAVRAADKNEENRLQGQLEEARVAMAGLDDQLRILDERAAQLRVKSPRAGVVATFQVEQLLLHRPVKRGDVLMEVMDDAGPWRLEIQIPEHRMFHVLRACERRGSVELPVEFVTATMPERTFHGTLSEIATRAATDNEGRVVELFVSVEADELPAKRIGADVRARIETGRRSLGYVLFGDVVEYLQRRFWWW